MIVSFSIRLKNRRILSLSFCLASRAYGSVGTVEQDSYSYTPPEEEVEKGQTININKEVRNQNRKNHSQKQKFSVV